MQIQSFLDLDVSPLLDVTIQKLYEEIHNKHMHNLNELFILALEKKGYTFNDDEECRKFIAEHCSLEIDGNDKIYSVNDTPFFFIRNNHIGKFNHFETERSIKFEEGFFKWRFL